MNMTYRPATPTDLDHIKWALYTALTWNPERDLPPPDITLQHPEALRYHRDWGRTGDLGVVAMDADEIVGIAYCRRFTEDDHGHGFIGERTPELVVGVREGRRGRGLGAELIKRLAEAARAAGFERLSLSVDTDNPARRLYERLGFRNHSADEDGVRMIIELVEGADRPAAQA